MIVLDTNVVSELMRPEPLERVLTWTDAQLATEPFLTAVPLAELLYSVGRLPDGRRRRTLADLLDEMVADDFERRILGFDDVAAAHCADIVVERERAGQPISMGDAQIAATCRSHGAPIATRNVDDFTGTGIDIIDPWSVD